MPHFKRIYAKQAADYDRLVAREDSRGNLLPAIQAVRSLKGLDIVELGAGTGRLSRLIAPLAGSLTLVDSSPHMLSLAREHLARLEHANWRALVGDNRRLPVAGASADLAIAGWSLGHFTGWHPDEWLRHISMAVAEMKRVLRPGGTLIILETLGTGRESPMPPSKDLADYYGWMEEEQGFDSKWLRTDYRFSSAEEAGRLISFFFGVEAARAMLQPGQVEVPECTGIWWLTV